MNCDSLLSCIDFRTVLSSSYGMLHKRNHCYFHLWFTSKKLKCRYLQMQAINNGILEIKFVHSENLPNIYSHCYYDIFIMLLYLFIQMSLFKTQKNERK